MDRRDFLKVIFAAPLAAPLLAAAKTSGSGPVLYLIADEPQNFLPGIIQQLKRKAWAEEGRAAFLNQHPFAEELERSLSENGWRFVSSPSAASLLLSFEPLRHAASPSFTLIKEGRIWDIRNQGLSRLWKEMNRQGAASTCLTIASFEEHRFPEAPGKAVAVYADGKRRESLSLDANLMRRYTTRNGEVVIEIEKGRARVLASTCRHKICLSSPPACLAGERIVCAPNQFLLAIEGRRFVDTVTG